MRLQRGGCLRNRRELPKPVSLQLGCLIVAPSDDGVELRVCLGDLLRRHSILI
jgi:hypothetical protein